MLARAALTKHRYRCFRPYMYLDHRQIEKQIEKSRKVGKEMPGAFSALRLAWLQ